ncbi:uncharacterized protein [Musca autumnalis]|uniref:uncharacterized protein n=1 Tax=Musca autumnalis TaxID=221902 RepID=UPI003CF3C7EC
MSLFGVGRSTVGEIVIDFCNAIYRNLSHCINSYPQNPDEIKRIVDGFENLGFPQCFGADDGCHIEIHPKKEYAVDYHNYKNGIRVIEHFFISCYRRSKFTYINIGSSGKNNDSYIFEKSSLKKFHESAEIFAYNSKVIGVIDVPVLLIGDSTFRLSRYMMKPFPYSINQPDVEKIFNDRLSRCRHVVENAFGQLKARFSRIVRSLKIAPQNVNIAL